MYYSINIITFIKSKYSLNYLYYFEIVKFFIYLYYFIFTLIIIIIKIINFIISFIINFIINFKLIDFTIINQFIM